MKQRKRGACLLLAMLLALSMQPAQAATKLAVAGESDALRLYLDTRNVVLSVEDKQSGMLWHTSPEDRAEDSIAQGAIPNDLASMLLVKYVDSDNISATVSARAGSISQGTVVLKRMTSGAGLVVEYQFSRKKEGFTIPLRITAEGNALRVEIQYDAIVEEGPARITEISLLPYFGAGNASEDGFALIPDGSGACISFDSMKSWAQPYRARVYGRDESMSPVYEGPGLQQAYLPAFGFSRAGGSMLGVIAAGDENAYIEALCPGITSSYAAVWSTFIYRQTDVTVLADNKWNEKQINVTSDRVETENPVVYYYFSAQSGAGELARMFRAYLSDSLGAVPRTEAAPSLVMEVYGVTQKEQSLAGVVQETRVGATTFGQAAQMLQRLSQEGVSGVELQLFGFLNGGMYYATPEETRWDPLTGGSAGYDQLLASAQACGATLFAAADPQNMYQASSLEAITWAPRRLDNGTAWRYAFSLSTGNRIEEERWFSIRPARLGDVAQKLSAGWPEGIGLLALGYGSTLYGDYGTDAYFSRGESKALVEDVLQELGQERPLAVMGANLYAALAAGRVAEAPLHSSGYDLTDWDIPFYAMAMGEYVALSSTPLNAQGDQALLDCLIAGVTPAFRITGDFPAVFAESRLDFLYNTSFEARWGELISAWQAYQQLAQATAGKAPLEYRQEGELRLMSFEGDVHLAVNGGQEDAAIDDRTIPAGGWLIY